jgi:hypothetical protein
VAFRIRAKADSGASGAGGELQQATLLHDGRETQEQRLIGTEQFTNQYEAE